jgi:hypothetical protein
LPGGDQLGRHRRPHSPTQYRGAYDIHLRITAFAGSGFAIGQFEVQKETRCERQR